MDIFPFYALIDRMKWIRRWSLMRNVSDENLAEHTLMTSIIAHALGVIRNTVFSDQSEPVNEYHIAVVALFHDVPEILTGDLPTPIKYHSNDMIHAYEEIETKAILRLLDGLPKDMATYYSALFDWNKKNWTKKDYEEHQFVKAADKLSAYIKCIQEVEAGNHEFDLALKQVKQKLDIISLPECKYFMDHFLEPFAMSLDEMNESLNE